MGMAGTMAGKRTGENWLSAKAVAVAKTGMHADGGGLYLDVRGAARSWLYRYQIKGRRREMGLGSALVYGLADARQKRDAARRLVADGIDPLDVCSTPQGAHSRTWGDAAEDFIKAQETGWKNDEQAAQWRHSLMAYGPPKETPVRAVDTHMVAGLLSAIWTSKTETATRVRGRIERIWNAEKVRGTVAGENPARWRGHLDALLAPPSKVAKPRHFPAMPYPQTPAFMVELRARPGHSARALEFLILTAARTEEVVGAVWREFDLDAGLWRRPAERMKGGKAHAVPLSEPALAILRALPRNLPPFRMSENTMLYLMQRAPPKGMARKPYTVHGFRSTFRDWGAETTDTPNEVLEMALAHVIEDKSERAYRRGELLDKRRVLMDLWAAYLR